MTPTGGGKEDQDDLALDAIFAPAVSETVNDGQSSVSEERNFLNKHRALQLRDYEQDIDARRQYATKLFWLIAAWLVAILVILCLAAWGGQPGYFKFVLSDGVLIALIGSTTATVIGLFIVVVNYLFPKRP